ncbi:LacI family repressor for deo operon, udp, cdd, tsx, nupC, and nupG [Rhizobium sp. BK529]|uniref:LacI family DNA-binding transcriptional regulator n=1 Tax=unclassified Rhizobium TaxID=2613769 RepID=UPI001042F966|nr:MULTISPECIES: LacI family DNA-binding transcriptional regulator [unclassified Rhizobium]MBB3593271.1 LacI family repressor for deo operon, udp, cdd, tsx, nupC, and nupG [Rhizobium sp. BK529]TCS03071.1 LacI family transcriptional regulator [Rhizobium sp. BK418]
MTDRSAPTRHERSATVADVARLANVSTAAVSFYFSDRAEHLKRVGAEARERIRAAVDVLGYVPNKTARHLRRLKSERLCIILPKLGIPYADKMIQDLGRAAVASSLLPIVSTASSVAELQKVLGEVEAGLADGVVADVGYLTEEEVEEVFSGLTRKCLVIHATARPSSFSVLNNGLVSALEAAFDALLAKGHRDFTYIQNAGADENPRLVAMLNSAERAGVSVSIKAMLGAESRAAAASCAQDIAKMRKRPTAVLLESDFTAVTVIEEFARLGVKVPTDIAVVGCGNAEEGYYCQPRLSTIGPEWLPLEEAGQYLIDCLLTNEPSSPKRFFTPWRFIPRESC